MYLDGRFVLFFGLTHDGKISVDTVGRDTYNIRG